jgi:TRAP-type mannitol/chloroaromatic compound transport system permease small subunit
MADVPERLDPADELIAERRSGAPGDLPEDMAPFMRISITALDMLSLWVGRIACLIVVPMIGAMVYEVVARKLFIAPTDWAYDVSRMLSGALFMLGAGYALMRGVHIRADFLYRMWSPRGQAWVDALLYLFLFFPGMLFFLAISFEYSYDAWASGERSMDTAWMAPLAPARTAMPLGALFLILQGVSELLKCAYTIKHNRWP